MQINLDLNPMNFLANKKTVILVITGVLVQAARLFNINIPDEYLSYGSNALFFLALLTLKLGEMRYQKEIQGFFESVQSLFAPSAEPVPPTDDQLKTNFEQFMPILEQMAKELLKSGTAVTVPQIIKAADLAPNNAPHSPEKK